MTQKQSEAQQARRARERAEDHAATQAAKAADAAAARAPDNPEFQPDPSASQDAFTGEQKEFKRGNPVRSAAYEQMMQDRQARQEEAVHEAPRPEAAPAPAATSATPATPATEPTPEPEPETVKVKIDGEELEVSKAEVEEYGGVSAYRIHKASERRLAEAKQAAADARALFEQARAQANPPKPQEPEKKPEEIVKEYVGKIQLGTPEEAASALVEAVNRLVPKPVDMQQAAMQAYFLTQVTQAENRFVSENKDLVENPLIRTLVVAEKEKRLGDLRKQNRLPDDWNQFYNSIASDIRKAMGRPPTAPAPSEPASQPPSGLAEKEARKASILALPTAATRAAAPEADKPLTRDEIIARARKARGQPV